MRASTKPIESTVMNNAKTYFWALEVIKKILFGSKNFNIIYFMMLLVWKIYLIKNVEGDNNDEGIIYTPDQIDNEH